MSRTTLAIAFSCALSLVALTVAAVSVSSSKGDDTAPAPTSSRNDGEMVARLSSLEERLDTLDESLNRRPKKRSVSKDPKSDNESPDDESNESEESSDDLTGAFTARLDSIETRLQGLEEDPVERGYTYLQAASADLRKQGLYTLERFASGDPQALAAIRAALEDDDASVRQASLDTLADLGDKDSIPDVLAYLTDESAQVRAEAALTLARLGAKDSGEAIAGLLGDENDKVRERAADALGDLQATGAAPHLLGLINDKNSRVKSEAISSLAKIGAKEAVPALRAMYDDDPGDHKYRLISSLRQLGDNEPYNVEITRLQTILLEDQDASRRRGTIRSLYYLGGDASREVIKKALQDSDKGVRESAQRMLRGESSRRR